MTDRTITKIPKGWKMKTLGEVGITITGKTPSKDNPEDWGEYLDFITPTDIFSDSKYIASVARKLSKGGAKRFSKMILPSGSIVVTCIGSDMGKVVINKNVALTNQQINSIKVNEENDKNYIYYFLKNSYSILRNVAIGGSTMPILNKSTFESLDVSLPSLPEQYSIAAILSSLDDKIELLRSQNKTLNNIAQALFRHWFVDFEFPDKDGKPYKSSDGKMTNSTLQELPNGWTEGTIGDIGRQITERVRNEITRKVLSAVNTGNLVLSEDYFTKQVFSESISNYIKCDAGDFAYNPARVNIGSIGRNNLGVSGAVSPVYVVFRPKSVFSNWLEFIIKTNGFKSHVEKFANGSVRQTLNYDGFSRFELIIPDEKTIKQFDDIILCLNSKTNFNNFRIQTLSKIRDTILPKLMKGEVRIKGFNN